MLIVVIDLLSCVFTKLCSRLSNNSLAVLVSYFKYGNENYEIMHAIIIFIFDTNYLVSSLLRLKSQFCVCV